MPHPIFRGEFENTPLIVSVWIRSLEDVEETIELWTNDLAKDEFWWIAGQDLNPISGLINHIGGASKRLLQYAQGKKLDETKKPTAAQKMIVQDISPELVLAKFKNDLDFIKKELLRFDDDDLNTSHNIASYQTKIKAAFILQHLVEHAQLYVGQIILVKKLIRN